MTRGKIGNVFVDISRTGYTGDLGYEIWVPWNDAVKVWDAIDGKGQAFDIHAAGMLALDVARVEAGLLLIEVDYTSAKKALIASQKYSPYELGFGKMVHLDKENFIGKAALDKIRSKACRGNLWDSKSIGRKLKRATKNSDSRRQRPARLHAWRFLCTGDKQVGKATTTTWSPILKKMIALASVETAHSRSAPSCRWKSPSKPSGNR